MAQYLSGCQKDIVPPPTEKAQSVSTSKRKPTLAGEDEPKEKRQKEKPPHKKNVPRMQEGRRQFQEASFDPCQKGSQRRSR